MLLSGIVHQHGRGAHTGPESLAAAGVSTCSACCSAIYTKVAFYDQDSRSAALLLKDLSPGSQGQLASGYYLSSSLPVEAGCQY